MIKEDLTGMRFGRLLALSEMEERRNGRIVYLCKCDCGRYKEALAKTLKNGGTRSCGCLLLETSTKRMSAINEKKSVPIWHKRKHCGYVEIKTVDGFKSEHVFVVEEYLGRALQDDEVIHHCDGVKTNNYLSNLELMLSGEHTAMHSTGRECSKSTRKKISEAKKKRVIKDGHRGYKLNEEKVRKIKRLLSSGETYQSIADIFGVSKSMIASINKKRTWIHVKG